MAFVPYQIQAGRLPKLRKGHVLKIGAKFYSVVEVRRTRKTLTEPLVLANQPLDVNYNPAYANLHGALDLKRVVHLQYIAHTTAIACLYTWITEPLLSAWVQDPLNAVLAGIANPFEIDKWSYDVSMSLFLTKVVGAQVMYMEIMEYKVAIRKGTDTPKAYLELDAKGEAVFKGF